MCPAPNNSPISESVLQRIQEQKIAMRSRLSVVAERLGLDGMGVLLFLIAVLAINLIFFWAKSTELVDSLAFGSVGLHAFLEAFPYQWLIVGILAFLAGASLLRALHTDYQPPYRVLVMALVGSAILIGTISAFAGMTERLLASVDRDGAAGQPTRAVYALTEHHGTGSLVGNVVETIPNGFIVQVGRENIQVITASNTEGTDPALIGPGDRILVVGTATAPATLTAAGIRRLPQLQLPHVYWVFHRFPAPVSL